ncbi:MAG: hypothetical protein WCA89_17135, partial [Terracidiphilus sp.]
VAGEIENAIVLILAYSACSFPGLFIVQTGDTAPSGRKAGGLASNFAAGRPRISISGRRMKLVPWDAEKIS